MMSTKFSQKKNPALFIEHRKNFRNGEIVTDFSGTIENQKVNITKEDKKRGRNSFVGAIQNLLDMIIEEDDSFFEKRSWKLMARQFDSSTPPIISNHLLRSLMSVE